MSLDPNSRSRFNLASSVILLLESGTMSLEILVQILVGFGAKTFHKCTSVDEAKEIVGKVQLDLILVGSRLAQGDAGEFIRWVRRSATPPNRFAPIIVTAAHTPISQVTDARDCGAHFTIAKPMTPAVVLERILWVAREQRSFITSDAYAGPDRRFKFAGPPPNTTGRRQDDLSADVGEASAPNMSQEQIDALMQPRKVSI